jgi:hypothetical protein
MTGLLASGVRFSRRDLQRWRRRERKLNSRGQNFDRGPVPGTTDRGNHHTPPNPHNSNHLGGGVNYLEPLALETGQREETKSCNRVI